MRQKVVIFWFRRDLRMEDNAGLFYALKMEAPVQPIFIFDTEILDTLESKADARVEFIHREIVRLSEELNKKGAMLDVRVGKPIDVWKKLVEDYKVELVYANRDYEPYARERDRKVNEFLRERGIGFKTKKDHVIFEKDEILKKDGKPYTVNTPYNRAWKNLLNPFYLKPYPSESLNHWRQQNYRTPPTLTELEFKPTSIPFPQRALDEAIVKNYHQYRDIPCQQGTTRMSVHLRFGTVSIRKLVDTAMRLNEKYLNELIWREFYQAILWHFPKVKDQPFNQRYRRIQWRNNEEEFEKWKQGKTGYPMVDAGIRELNETGFMHNRARMITASFLTKHLLIDWRWGEAYFANKLLDFELASNNGGWQWAAGTGVDAVPYFRIFNPAIQADKFDKEKKYICQWIPECNTPHYPKPMVEHKMARKRAIEAYKEALREA